MSEHKESRKGALFIALGALGTLAAQVFIFSPKARENREKARQLLSTARDEVKRRVEQIQGLDEATFRSIVDEVTERYAKLQEVGPRVASRLARELKKSWKEIKTDLNKK